MRLLLALLLFCATSTAQFSVQFHPSATLSPARYIYNPAVIVVFEPWVADPFLIQRFTYTNPVSLTIREAWVLHGNAAHTTPCAGSSTMLRGTTWNVDYEFPSLGVGLEHHTGLNMPLTSPTSYYVEYGGIGWGCWGGPRPYAVAFLMEIR